MTPPMIVAEMSGNHDGRLSHAIAIITAAANAGADAVKLQTFNPEQMADKHAQASGPWAGRDLQALYAQTCIPRAWHQELFAHAENRGLFAFSSVFHKDDVDFLETLNCPMYKIASFEITDIPLIQHAASTKKPLVISTGMATYPEVVRASQAAYMAGCGQLTLLKCTSAYPAPITEMNLRAMPAMRQLCNGNYGLSDHTTGITAAVVATALGAKMIEKHLKTVDSTGPDAAFSITPSEFMAMTEAIKDAAKAIGEIHFGPSEAEQAMLSMRRPPNGKRGQVSENKGTK